MKNILKSHWAKIVLLLMIPIALVLFVLLTSWVLKEDVNDEVQSKCQEKIIRNNLIIDSLGSELEKLQNKESEIVAIDKYKKGVDSTVEQISIFADYPGSDISVFRVKINLLKDKCILNAPKPKHSELNSLVTGISENLILASHHYLSIGERQILSQEKAIDENNYIATLETLLDESRKELAKLEQALESAKQGNDNSSEVDTVDTPIPVCDHRACQENKDSLLHELRLGFEVGRITFFDSLIQELEDIKVMANRKLEPKEYKKVNELLKSVVNSRDELLVEVKKILADRKLLEIGKK